MAFLGFRRKGRVLDLTEKYRRDQEKLAEMNADSQEAGETESSTGSAFGFLGGLAASGASSSTETESMPETPAIDDRRRRLTKRLLDMTEKIEDLSNQIYHLQQRIEVLEKKSGVGSY